MGRVLARGEAQVAGEDELAAGATGPPPNRRDADRRRARQTGHEIQPRVHPGRPGRHRRGPARVALRVVVREEVVEVGTGEDDDVQLAVSVRSWTTSSESSAIVVAVIVLIGGWSSVTRQSVGLRRSSASWVHDVTREVSPLRSVPVMPRSVARRRRSRARETTGPDPGVAAGQASRRAVAERRGPGIGPWPSGARRGPQVQGVSEPDRAPQREGLRSDAERRKPADLKLEVIVVPVSDVDRARGVRLMLAQRPYAVRPDRLYTRDDLMLGRYRSLREARRPALCVAVPGRGDAPARWRHVTGDARPAHAQRSLKPSYRRDQGLPPRVVLRPAVDDRVDAQLVQVGARMP